MKHFPLNIETNGLTPERADKVQKEITEKEMKILSTTDDRGGGVFCIGCPAQTECKFCLLGTPTRRYCDPQGHPHVDCPSPW